MYESRPDLWSDDEVSTYLLSHETPLNGWCVGPLGDYGFVHGHKCFECIDDYNDRATRIVDFLRKSGARDLDEAMSKFVDENSN
jgi:hypothetical protein